MVKVRACFSLTGSAHTPLWKPNPAAWGGSAYKKGRETAQEKEGTAKKTGPGRGGNQPGEIEQSIETYKRRGREAVKSTSDRRGVWGEGSPGKNWGIGFFNISFYGVHRPAACPGTDSATSWGKKKNQKKLASSPTREWEPVDTSGKRKSTFCCGEK